MGMTEKQIYLIRLIAENRFQEVKKAALACLAEDDTKKNHWAVTRYTNMLETSVHTAMELPVNIKGMAVAEDISAFRTDRYFLTDREAELLSRIKKANSAALKLMEMQIPYLNSVLLTGESGTGKTMFGRFVAHEMDLPFVYVNFSYLIDSYMGNTSKNLRNVFDYVKFNRCLLMLDEIDAIAQQRDGAKSGVSREFANTTITLLQELDQIGNDSILIGATNIPDSIDHAVMRRFALKHEILPLSIGETQCLAQQYIKSTGMRINGNVTEWASKMANKPQAAVVNELIRLIADAVLEGKEEVALC